VFVLDNESITAVLRRAPTMPNPPPLQPVAGTFETSIA